MQIKIFHTLELGKADKINTADLRPGMYMLKMQNNENRSYNTKLMIIR